jgi:long-subunit acyl-CoA synthetase (AMP-forming)
VSEIQHLPLLKPYLSGLIVIGHSHQRFRLCQSDEPRPASQNIPNDIASINYTYRGNGYPLGAMISHAQYLHGAKVLQDGLQGQSGEKMLVILPMAHIFTLVGCILVPLLYRMTSVIACTLHPRHLFRYIE